MAKQTIRIELDTSDASRSVRSFTEEAEGHWSKMGMGLRSVLRGAVVSGLGTGAFMGYMAGGLPGAVGGALAESTMNIAGGAAAGYFTPGGTSQSASIGALNALSSGPSGSMLFGATPRLAQGVADNAAAQLAQITGPIQAFGGAMDEGSKSTLLDLFIRMGVGQANASADAQRMANERLGDIYGAIRAQDNSLNWGQYFMGGGTSRR